MDWAKLFGVGILALITFPIGGFIWVPVLFFGWKYVKFCLKIDLMVLYLLVRLPVWLLIQLPLYSLKVSSHKIDEILSGGFNGLERRKKLTGFLLLFFGAIFLFLIGVDTAANVLSPYFWWNNIRNAAYIIVATFTTTFIIVTLIETFSGGVAQGEVPGEWAVSGLLNAPQESVERSLEGAQTAAKRGRQAKDAYQKSKQAGRKAKGAFNDIKAKDFSKPSYKGPFPSDLKKIASNLGKSLGIDLGEEGALAVGGTSLGLLLALIFVLALLLFVFQLALVVFFFYTYIQFIAPIVLGPVTAALGLGSDYGSFIGGEVADNYIAGTTVQIEQYTAPLAEARQRVYCLLQGPSCLRQWRLNNTRNPGSESVGEQYLLQVERLEVGSGDRLNVAYKNGGYEIPISFGLSNSRNGLKGINAYNVSYRLKMIDFDRGRNDPYCNTGWRPINGYDIKRSDNTGDFRGNDLYPGTSASTGFIRLDNFDLENCGLLQPGAGQTRTVLLEVKYDYFSQATLYFEAMAREAKLSNPDIQEGWKRSETADTPVKSYLNVYSPVLYNQDTTITPTDLPTFSMRTRLYTEENDVEYKIQNLQIIKSSKVDISNNPNSQDRECSFEKKQGTDNILIPDEEASRIFENPNIDSGASQVTGGDELAPPNSVQTQQSDPSSIDNDVRWYGSDTNPPFFGCTMQLNEPDTISPEGETLTMGVESNYTVKLSEQLERFEAYNSRCSTINCPLIVTRDFAIQSDIDERNWKYECDGPDAGRTGSTAGCTVVRGEPSDWSTIEPLTGNDKLEERLDVGEIAIDPAKTDILQRGYADLQYGEEEAAIGLTERQIDSLENEYSQRYEEGDDTAGYAFLSYINEEGNRDTDLRELEYVRCESEATPQDYKDFVGLEYLIENNRPDPRENLNEIKYVSFVSPSIDCKQKESWEGTTCSDETEGSFKVFEPGAGIKCIGGTEA